jgi:hypothetical protein
VNFWLDIAFFMAHKDDFALVPNFSVQLPHKGSTPQQAIGYGKNKYHFISMLFPNFELANYKLEDFEFTEYDAKNNR